MEVNKTIEDLKVKVTSDYFFYIDMSTNQLVKCTFDTGSSKHCFMTSFLT